MAFTSLRFYHFRNLEDARISVDAREVFLVGNNGQGKTNFLEAVYLICYGSSFRTRRMELLRRRGEPEMAVEGTFTNAGETRTIRYALQARNRTITVDGADIADRARLVQNVPCVVFCHDDFGIVTGSPDVHRWFFDQTAALVDHRALDPQRRYQRVLRLRNSALREQMYELLPDYDAQLAEAGAPLVSARTHLVERVNAWLTQMFAFVFEIDRELCVEYRPSWSEPVLAEQTDAIVEHLEQHRERDREMATTTSGPHRDRFVFRLGDAHLTDVGSTGQLRLVSLILRVVQARLIAEYTGRLPVLLLDDVLLELDPRRRERMLEIMPEYEQAFFTFLPDERYARYQKHATTVLTVSDGVIRE